MTAHEDLEKVLRGAWTELLHAEVFEHKQVDVGELIDEASPFACGFGFERSPEPGRRRYERSLDNRPGWRRLAMAMAV